MPQRLLGILLFGLVTACSAEAPNGTAATPEAAPTFVAGTDYQLIDPPVAFGSDDRIDVVEVFGYNCIHCAHAQPFISEWKKSLPADVHFEYMPAVFGGVWEAFGRAFYTAQTMGLLDRTHEAMFAAVHEQKRFNNLEDVAAFYAEHGGGDPQQVLATMSSFPVETKLAEARQTVQAFGVEGTPTMVIEGKYRVSVPRAENGFQRMLEIVDFLIEQERAARR